MARCQCWWGKTLRPWKNTILGTLSPKWKINFLNSSKCFLLWWFATRHSHFDTAISNLPLIVASDKGVIIKLVCFGSVTITIYAAFYKGVGRCWSRRFIIDVLLLIIGTGTRKKRNFEHRRQANAWISLLTLKTCHFCLWSDRDHIPRWAMYYHLTHWGREKRLLGENSHNSVNIRASALKLLAFDRASNFSENQAKTRHLVANKIEQSSIFLANLVKISAFFIDFLAS